MVFKDRLKGLVGGPAWFRAWNHYRQVRLGKQALGLLLVSVAALMTIGCGGSSSSSPTPATATSADGALYTLIGDTPACDLLQFSVYLTEMDLHSVGAPSTSLQLVWPTNTSPTSPVVGMSTLRDATTVANLTSFPPGTYDQVVLKLIVENAAVFDPTKTPPASNFSATGTTTTVTINLQPSLTITSGKVSVLKLDLNLPQSLVTSQGQLTGAVNWVFTGRQVSASGSSGFGEFDNLYGFVRSVNLASPGTGFTNSFELQTLSGTGTLLDQGPALNVDLTDNTNLCFADSCQTPVSQLNQLTTGSFVQVDGYIDQNGNLVANAIQVEDRESVSQQLLAYLGPVLSVTRDPNGNVTQFDLLVRETAPGDTTDIPTDTIITVYVSPTTTFKPFLASSDLAALASSGNLTFDPSTLVPGQNVVVHGVFTKSAGGPISVAANTIYPQLQAVQGNFSQLAAPPGSDNKTGVFDLTPCAGIFGGLPFMVVTDAQTNFANTSGLNTLSPTTPLLVRGLLFLDRNGSTINGVQIPAGTLVLVAKQVRQT